MAKSGSVSPRKSRASKRAAAMVFERRNYVLLLIGVALVVFGYALMRWDNQVDGVLSLYVAPLIILGGYVEIVYAILWRPRGSDPSADADSVSAQS